jgi:ABC-2 type transport system ATP-binding protein
VSELDLDVLPREVFGLLGPNGSGKSTTLKMILGLLFPTRGQIAVLGRPPADVAVKKRIGFLPEESYLYPFLDARETLDFYGRLFQQPRQERRRRIDMLLDMVGLSSVAFRRVGEYSKGMQRRIGLAQALINDPDVLILDEPTSGMDPIGTREFKDLIRTLALRGKTVIVSSHLLADVEDVCDRVCILYGGKRRAMGSIDDLLAQGSLTQLTTDDLSPELIDRVRDLLAQAGKDLRSVTRPRDRLETLFLRIVQEAQDQKVITGGAVAGGKVADFLRGQTPEARQVIDELLAAKSQEKLQEPVAAAAPAAPAQPVKEVLDVLMAPKPAVRQEAPPPPPPKPSQADRSVIDQLLRKDDGKGKS